MNSIVKKMHACLNLVELDHLEMFFHEHRERVSEQEEEGFLDPIGKISVGKPILYLPSRT